MNYFTLREIRKNIESSFIDYESFTIRGLKGLCGITYQQAYHLEKRGIIDKLPRDPQGKILIPRKMMINILLIMEACLLGEYNRKGIICKN